MRISTISTLLFLFFSVTCIAQSNNNSKNTEDNNIYARIAYHLPNFDFSISDAADKGEPIDYNANVPFAINVSLNYKSYGLSVSKNFRSSVEQGELTETKYTDIQFNYLRNRFGAELYYQNYKGYNLYDGSKFGSVEGDIISARPDINNQNIGLNAFFLFNKKHSLKTLLNHFSKPDKFEFSFLMMSSFNSLKLSSSRNIIPATETIYYGENSDYRGGRYNVLSVAPGFSIAIPGRRFYFSTVFMFGYGMSYSENHFANENPKGIDSFMKYNLKMAYGYCGKKMIAGLAYNLDSLFPINKLGSGLVFQTFCGTYDVFIGYKF
jgi:hypothetical protein